MSDKHVYQAINEVQKKLAAVGIGKDHKNDSQGYKFRGIDDIYNALSTMLAESQLCILPNVLHRDVSERINTKGTTLFYVAVKTEFEFVSAKDGSSHKVTTFGEAMDSGDKATNKAMSAAYKYACLQAFCIPTEGDNDADKSTHEVKPNITPLAGAGDDLTQQQRNHLADLAIAVCDSWKAGDKEKAYKLYLEVTDVSEKTYLWSMIGTEKHEGTLIRSQLKTYAAGLKKEAA